jgi:hypothetical protein
MGSVMDGILYKYDGAVVGVHLTYVNADDNGRSLNLNQLDNHWNPSNRFLRARKSLQFQLARISGGLFFCTLEKVCFRC